MVVEAGHRRSADRLPAGGWTNTFKRCAFCTIEKTAGDRLTEAPV
ncbi:MAG: hypothetical protein WDZ59_02520 [Pirellulales bacterium]